MKNNFSRSQTIRKPVTITSSGVVAAQHVRAAEIGADILKQGGDAVDAAIAVSFAIGVLEPWMSGPAGGGAMMLWREDEQKAYALSYGMKSPKSLDVAAFPIIGDEVASDLFPWKAVVDDRNVQGPLSIGVPGTVAGTSKIYNKFAKLPWKDLLQPAIDCAKEGVGLDWYSSLIIASATRALSADPDAAALFLEDGQWPSVSGWTAQSDNRLDMSQMGATLEQLAHAGADDFYRGDVAASMVKDIQAKGGFLSMADLADYSIEFEEPLSFNYRNSRFLATPGLTSGPTFSDTLSRFEQGFTPEGQPNVASFAASATAIKKAYLSRLQTMGDQDSPKAPACTTHFSIVDRHGNMVSMTQTLLSIFGSRVVSPSTGLLMNNGVMWFDPEPGLPNSLAPDKKCLMNVCPIIGESGNKRFALGASGGRKIMNAVALLSSYISDFDMSLEDAFHHPRIDASAMDSLVADESLAPEILEALGQQHNLITTKRTVFPYSFACPAGVMREDGKNMGCTEIMSPWGDAVAEDRSS